MTTDSKTLIKVEDLQKSFGKIEVLKGVNTEIKKGEVIVPNKGRKISLKGVGVADLRKGGVCHT